MGLTPETPDRRLEASGDEEYFAIPVGVRRWATASSAEAGAPSILAGDFVGPNIVFAFYPAEAISCGIKNGVAVGSRHFSAL